MARRGKPPKAKARRSGPLTADDWAAAALEAFVDGGPGAVAVEPLARRLRVTKGSFYWHFKDRRELLQAALRRWARTETEAVIEALRSVTEPRERLVRLFWGVGHSPRGDLERAVLAAASHPEVRPFAHAVTIRRVDYMRRAYRALGFDRDAARHRALLAYTAYVGFVTLTDETRSQLRSKADFDAYGRHFIETLVPPVRP